MAIKKSIIKKHKQEEEKTFQAVWDLVKEKKEEKSTLINIDKYLKSEEYKKSSATLDEIRRMLIKLYPKITNGEMHFLIDESIDYNPKNKTEMKKIVLGLAKKYMRKK